MGDERAAECLASIRRRELPRKVEIDEEATCGSYVNPEHFRHQQDGPCFDSYYMHPPDGTEVS
jgi:hypothetical protein